MAAQSGPFTINGIPSSKRWCLIEMVLSKRPHRVRRIALAPGRAKWRPFSAPPRWRGVRQTSSEAGL